MPLSQTVTAREAADMARRGLLTPTLTPGRPQRAGSAELAIPPPLAKVLGQILLGDVRGRFATQTTPAGQKWRPLGRSRPQGGDVPLNNTGRLRASLSVRSDATGI